MHIKALLAICVILVGCQPKESSNVTVTVPVSSTLGASGSEKPTEPDPAEEALEKLDSYPAVPVERGKPAPNSGILFSPRQAAESILDAAEAEKLGIENKVLVGTRQQEIQLYEQRIKELQSDLVKAKSRTFWEQHGAVISGVVGAVVAAGFSLGIFKASQEIRND